MAGVSVHFTAGVMGSVTRLPSSKRENTCLEDTLIYLGVNNISLVSGLYVIEVHSSAPVPV